MKNISKLIVAASKHLQSLSTEYTISVMHAARDQNTSLKDITTAAEIAKDKIHILHFKYKDKPNYIKLEPGMRVYDLIHNTEATIIDNYGDPINGNRGEMRLDTDGNCNIFSYDNDYNRIGYVLIPIN